ncbi:NAD dependent epimerase/dehydratase [Purpureocillium lavendulum]|uniref:NAD dependent epimerase/dehydratase n=1 Tax=Purpureocillium lavendulum TaxID=1247861 RepID=A0AB34G3B7_9HYPO|nr:NAD dependent epimerase/dehydratase [Purpureocillium lavendulum]
MSKLKGTGEPERAVPMRVIVCGLHRTGTSSIRQALRQLGFHDCYHMITVFENSAVDPQQWVRAYEAKYLGKGSFDKSDWDRLLGYSQACCDLPVALFSSELAELYPDAKVVILNRDPERWYESVLGSVNQTMHPTGFFNMLQRVYIFLLDPQMRNWLRFSKVMATLGMPFDHAKEHDKAIAWFNERYAEFRANIPAERRIEFSVQDGWAPLCEHLGVPVPQVQDEKTGELVEAPFPHANDRAAFAVNAKGMISTSVKRANSNLVNLLGRACLMGCLGYGGFLMWKTRLGGRL